jgi:hypothetical protein
MRYYNQNAINQLGWLFCLIVLSMATVPLRAQAQANEQAQGLGLVRPQPANHPSQGAFPDPRKTYHGTEPKILAAAPADLPDLPRYTSRAYFLGGFDYPTDSIKQGRTLLLKYAVHEPKEQVLDWYRDALTSYSWKVTRNKESNNELMATKGQTSCFVRVADAKDKIHWFSSILTLNYKMGQ